MPSSYCAICNKQIHGNLGWHSHQRMHIRRGDLVLMKKTFTTTREICIAPESVSLFRKQGWKAAK